MECRESAAVVGIHGICIHGIALASRRAAPTRAMPPGSALTAALTSQAAHIAFQPPTQTAVIRTTVPRHSTSSRSTTSSLGCRLVGNIVTYIAGFVVKKALDSVSCSTCQEALVSDIQPDDMTQLYHLFIISAR
ncbi:hypothetical protein FJT64_004239 [Amphibalanus amphitrite]|uniref:Uncharacterized protein n=1 Tax=Amphibalanus amphitrite TaxID=1232801 RepID=A0A6A4VW50_AMPAM|nr:hypothetical protein FJT64_004239 [Amphibalanus amphitrite]